jgi:polyisoprenoid-binding protein YceI
MKNLSIIISTLALSLSAEASTAPTVTKANLDVAASTASWTGKKVSGTHTGKVAFKEGTFVYKKNKLSKGEVKIDLNSITNDDVKDAEYNKKLVDHLKGEDFFDAGKHPVATFKINSFSEIHNIIEGQPNLEAKGTLTIRGVTKPYTTKVFFTPNETGFGVKGKIMIDRTQFGLKYNSKKFFDLKKLGDKMIDDQFEVDLNLVAKK